MDPKDEIKQKIDIVELVGEYLELKPAGMNAFRTLCPFHSEKTPSFHVSGDRQIFHCFGCGEGGDIFTFVMKMEGMDFHEALVHLGNKAGVEIKRFDSAEGNTKQRLNLIHEIACAFYKKVLSDSSSSQKVREYVEGRGITKELIELFGLGYAPDEWSRLSDLLVKKSFSEAELVQSGLSLKRKLGTGLIDRFRNRLIIPLRDQHSHVVGFTARVLPGDTSDGPKYMNSPETPIYHKGRLLFGLDLAKRAVKESKCIIVVEGNLDVVASHKAKVENVVGSSGTAFTLDQLTLLKRYTNTVVFCFDRDAAGLTAAKKSVSIARTLGFDVRAITLPDDVKDPDDLVQKNPEAWKKLSTHSIPFMQYLIDRTFVGRDITNVDDKKFITQELLPAISEITDLVEQDHWLQSLSQMLGVDAHLLRQSIKEKKDISKKPETQTETHNSKYTKFEQFVLLLIGHAIQDESSRPRIIAVFDKILTEDCKMFPLYKALKQAYNRFENEAQQNYFAHLRKTFESENKTHLVSLLDEACVLAEQIHEEKSPNTVPEQLNSLLESEQNFYRQEKRKEFAQRLRLAESANDSEAVKSLLKQINDLI